MATPCFSFDNSYARELPGFYANCQPEPVSQPRLLFFHEELANELGMDHLCRSEELLTRMFSGNELPAGAASIAMAYAGHQFGNFSPQLGDGRALLLGEVIDRNSQRRDIAFKGSGKTPFSRGGDGKAAIGPMLREVLIGEALHALGIPTTRALAVVATGEPVYREELLPGAVLTRVAASHLRVGTFEYFAAREQWQQVRQLADYAIARHYAAVAPDENRYLSFLESVMERQALLLAQWMNVGFIHGVMNTDNMAISGESIDFGPCAFLEYFGRGVVFSSIDHQGRYAYGNQPQIAQWNLARLAESILPLLADNQELGVERAKAILHRFPARYQHHWLTGVRVKLGLSSQLSLDAEPVTRLANDWLLLLEKSRIDYTLAWRYLADAAEGNETPLRALFCEQEGLSLWLQEWRTLHERDPSPKEKMAERMRTVNPLVIPRNHRVEEALAAATVDGNLEPFRQLLQAVQQPFGSEQSACRYAEPAPAAYTENYCTFCGT